jgi:type IX secretion system PorP/SprF family membrane protein
LISTLNKYSLVVLLSFFTFSIFPQQYPWWSQYRGNQNLLNPAFCGTKRLVDARINYRNQWTNFDGAPKTYALTLNSRLLKGKLGVGGFMFKDDIGPFQNLATSLTFAFHLKFPDSELSFGLQGNYLSQNFNGTYVKIRHQQDNAVNQYINDKATTFDGSFGLVYFNDRFHFGLAGNNLASGTFEYYKKDEIKKGLFINVPHYNLSAGYNWADNNDFIFENSVMAVFVNGLPPAIDYSLRLHIKNQIISGFSLRFGDAIALHLGYTLNNTVQFTYSYDLVTSPLRKYQRGSHELTMVFSSNLGTDKKKRGLDKRFLRQRYQYML